MMTESKNFVVGFFMGSLVGAAVALLWAPGSGEETRGQIKDISFDARDKAAELVNKAGEAISTARDKATDYVAPAVDAASQAVGGVKEKAASAVGGVKEKAVGAVGVASEFVHVRTEQVKAAAQPLVETVSTGISHARDAMTGKPESAKDNTTSTPETTATDGPTA